MKHYSFLLALIILLILQCKQVQSQENSKYDQHAVFNSNLINFSESSIRSAGGIPGEKYWQNKTDYEIAVKLDTLSQTISGRETVTYTNNSSDNLSYLWFELGQNLFMEGSRGSSIGNIPTENCGFKLKSVKVISEQSTVDAQYIITDTRMQIRLDQPVQALGGKIQVKIEYSFIISDKQFRTGRVTSPKGTLYDVAQWYPRLCVYDDLRGWNTLPYLGNGEFYCEYGDFNYEITVPWDLIVVGSGELVNPDKVLTKTEILRLKKAGTSDKTVFIISPEEVANPSTRPVNTGTLTWQFKMKNSRDVAWAASKAYVWDAARINLPNEKTALAMSAYPLESIGDTAWSRSTEYLKQSVEHFSSKWYMYPYPIALNIAGSVDGMEYPGLSFCDWKVNTSHVMYLITAHEIGHNWFPMIVGSDERRFPFMDEGFNTFIDVYAQDAFNNGEFGPKRDGEFDPNGKNPARDLAPYLISPEAQNIMNLADVQGEQTHTLSYYKAALGLVIAREYILGPDRFDYAFREYIKKWTFKHPSPNDFFRLMNNAAGEDLNWFWNEWYYQTWTLDQGITEIKYVDNDPVHGAKITLCNLQQMAMPVKLKIKEKNGLEQVIKLPVEIWQNGSNFQYNYKSTSEIESVIIDPDLELPDVNDKNNRWPNESKQQSIN
ncbi:MAG: M1 family metallopeptidase [Prolixibacteraceae bacterium]|nr:M1 family metallopeptidase [Prolixibacteraceae bacterium]